MRRLRQLLALLGLDLGRLAETLGGLPWYLGDAWRYRRLASQTRFPLRLRDMRPMLGDRTKAAGVSFGHYFHQDLWAARKIYRRGVSKHLDIGSRLDGFVSHLLVFVPEVEVVDLRGIASPVAGLRFLQADATELSWLRDQSVTSLSSLHAVEHFGLGRYSDQVDPEAPFRFMRALARVLAPGGRLYFSVPVGRERVEFNSQRVFSPATVLQAFGDLDLMSFAAVTDQDELVDPASPEDLAGARNACGLFEFGRPT